MGTHFMGRGHLMRIQNDLVVAVQKLVADQQADQMAPKTSHTDACDLEDAANQELQPSGAHEGSPISPEGRRRSFVSRA